MQYYYAPCYSGIDTVHLTPNAVYLIQSSVSGLGNILDSTEMTVVSDDSLPHDQKVRALSVRKTVCFNQSKLHNFHTFEITTDMNG